MKSNITSNVTADVHYSVAILGPDGRTVREFTRKKNLILDQGLDGIASRIWISSFTAAAVGTGTTPTKRDSGEVTFARSGAVVTASAGFFVSTDVGSILKFDSGEEMYVVTFTNATSVIVSESGTLAAAEGTIWHVNQTALTTESKRTTTYSTDGGANGSAYSAPTWTHKRTFIFTAEVATVTYREIGWSHVGTAGANLFGRDLLAGVGVTLTAGQQLKVAVELSVSYGPAGPAAWTNPITGWTATGNHAFEGANSNIINAAGGNSAGGSGFFSPHSNNVGLKLSTAATALWAAPTNGDVNMGGTVTSVTMSRAGYVAGSFRITYTGTFGVTVGNRTDWRSLFVGAADHAPSSWYRVLLDTAATKDSDHRLTVTVEFRWGRNLVN